VTIRIPAHGITERRDACHLDTRSREPLQEPDQGASAPLPLTTTVWD
jgi:hypothetical protein